MHVLWLLTIKYTITSGDITSNLKLDRVYCELDLLKINFPAVGKNNIFQKGHRCQPIEL